MTTICYNIATICHDDDLSRGQFVTTRQQFVKTKNSHYDDLSHPATVRHQTIYHGRVIPTTIYHYDNLSRKSNFNKIPLRMRSSLMMIISWNGTRVFFECTIDRNDWSVNLNVNSRNWYVFPDESWPFGAFLESDRTSKFGKTLGLMLN